MLFPESNASATLTLNATASGDPYRLRIELNTNGLLNSTYSPSTGFVDQTFNNGNVADNDGSITPVVFKFESSDGDRVYSSVDDLTVVLPSYGTNGSALAAAKSISNGVITLTISGGWPSSGVDRTVSVQVRSGPIKTPATSIVLSGISGTLLANNATKHMKITANGWWKLSIITTDLLSQLMQQYRLSLLRKEGQGHMLLTSKQRLFRGIMEEW